MGRPYEWTVADKYPRDSYPIYDDSNDTIDKTLDFMACKLLDPSEEYFLKFKTRAKLENFKKLDIVFTNAFMSILLNKKIISILQEVCPDQIQVFDTVIECKDGVITDYKAVNILNEVDVSDPEKRKFYYLTNGTSIAGYDNRGFVMKEEMLEPVHIGRDKYSHATIIISSTLKEALEKAKVKGCKYGEGD